MTQEQKVEKKKIPAYPFLVEILEVSPPSKSKDQPQSASRASSANLSSSPQTHKHIRSHIVKLSELGFLMKTQHIFRVGKEYDCRFMIPATHHFIKAPIKVVKTYDTFETDSEKGLGKLYVVEMHFIGGDESRRNYIINFLAALEKKNRGK